MEFSKEFYIEIIDDVFFEIQKLRNTRIKLGISQRKMAEYMKITTQKLIRIEKGYSKMFLDDYFTYKKIIDFLVKNYVDSQIQK